jgi:hypothetical protein
MGLGLLRPVFLKPRMAALKRTRLRPGERDNSFIVCVNMSERKKVVEKSDTPGKFVDADTIIGLCSINWAN